MIEKGDTSHFAVKLNTQDLSSEMMAMPDFGRIYFSDNATENALVNLDFSSKGYYDVYQQEYFYYSTIDTLRYYSEAVSGNSILLRVYDDGFKEFVIHNTISKETINTSLDSGSRYDAYPDSRGGFYCHEKIWDGDTAALLFLHSDGGIDSIAEVPLFLYGGGDRTDGEVKSMAFAGEDEMLILSAYDGEYNLKSIPTDSLGYNPYHWYESDERSILEIQNGQFYDTYTFEFETDPRLIRKHIDERLILVIEETDRAILAYKNFDYLITFYEYDYHSDIVSELTSFQSTRNSSHSNEIADIGNSEYLLQLNDGIAGLEPWLLNTETWSLSLLKDMNRSQASSRPSDYTFSPDGKFYFSALTGDLDRQLYTLDMDSSLEPELNLLNRNLLVFPSPSNGTINIQSDFKSVVIFDRVGREFGRIHNHLNGTRVDVSHLANGIYFIKAATSYGTVKYGQFSILQN